MASEALRMAVDAEPRARPYAPSWLDLVFGAISRLPGPTWLAYLVLIVPSVVVSNSALWLSGLRPWGELEPNQVVWGTMTVVILAAAHHLRNVAGSAFDAFRPALGGGVADPDEARYEFTVMPARPVFILTVLSFGFTPSYYLADPVAAQVVGLNGLGLVARLASEGLVGGIVLAILFQAIRQMRQVTRLHAVADHVDPFRPAPLHAFSRLTAQAGIVLILFNAVGVVLNPDLLSAGTLVLLWVLWLVGFSVGAVVIFVVPLLGMHRRLLATKLELQDASEDRLKALLAELNADVDTRDLSRADALQKMLTSLLQQREVLAKLPTWPWSTGTVRGFGSALLLPLAIFMLQRVLAAAVPA